MLTGDHIFCFSSPSSVAIEYKTLLEASSGELALDKYNESESVCASVLTDGWKRLGIHYGHIFMDFTLTFISFEGKKNPQFWHFSPADHQVAELIREQWAIDLCGWEADWLSGRQDM